VPQIKIKHGTNCVLEDWFCDDTLLTGQECENVKDELEKYLSQRVLIFHLEQHCNHLDHFDQVSSFMAVNGMLK
jgi:hypothetical protein